MNARTPACLAALVLVAGCASVPPKPQLSSSLPAPVAQLSLRVDKVSESSSLPQDALRASLDEALRAAGFKLTADAAAEDGHFELAIKPKGATFTPYDASLALISPMGQPVESVRFVGGAVGNNLRATRALYRQIAESVAYNLVARMASSQNLAAYAHERLRTRGQARPDGAAAATPAVTSVPPPGPVVEQAAPPAPEPAKPAEEPSKPKPLSASDKDAIDRQLGL